MCKELVKIREFLAKPDFNGFTADDLFIKKFIKQGWGQDIAALSNMAEALRNIGLAEAESREEMAELIEQVVERAVHRSVNPWKKSIETVTEFGHFGYYLEHLNIILGSYQLIGDQKYLDLNTRVTLHLRDASMSQENAHARLLPHVKMRWSADQAAIIYSIWLYDTNNGTTYADKPLGRWLAYMHENATHPETGLFITEVMGTKKYSEQPRGCSVAYMIYYMSYFAPEVAKSQWALFKEHMGYSMMGLKGFREYLPDFEGEWTPDSGPIIAGVGVAATGLALKTAAALGDHEIFDAILRLASIGTTMLGTAEMIPKIGDFAKIGTDLLASSIILAAKTQWEFPREVELGTH